jgi:hypothetical protein
MASPTPKNPRSVLLNQLSGGGGPKVAGKQKPDGPLTDMQRQFVTNLVHYSMKPTAAARMAGFSDPEKTCVTLRKNHRQGA